MPIDPRALGARLWRGGLPRDLLFHPLQGFPEFRLRMPHALDDRIGSVIFGSIVISPMPLIDIVVRLGYCFCCDVSGFDEFAV